MTHLYPDPFGPPWKFNWLRMLLTWEGGIFQFFWVEWLFAVSVCTIVVTSVYFARQDTNKEYLDEEFVALVEQVSFINTRFQSALGLMLGFYTSKCYDFWHNCRSTEGSAMGGIYNAATQIGALIRTKESGRKKRSSTVHQTDDASSKKKNQVKVEIDGDYDETASSSSSNASNVAGKQQPVVAVIENDSADYDNDETAAHNVRMQLIRWLNLSHALVIGQLYGNPNNEFSSLDKLHKIGLVTEQEAQFLQNQTRARFVIPLVWFSDLIAELHSSKMFGVNDMAVKIFTEYVADTRGGLGGLFRFKSIPIPLSYRQLVNFTVRFYMVILLVYAAVHDIQRPENLGGMTKGSFWIILAYAFEYFLFVGWLSLADALATPFRCWADQYDWEKYVSGTLMDTVSIATKSQHESSLLSVALKCNGSKLQQQLMLSGTSVEDAAKHSHENLRERFTGY